MTGRAPRPADAPPRIGRQAGRQVPRVLALLLVGTLTVPFLRASSRVAVVVDGQVVATARSYDDTVGQVLAATGVEFGPDDSVVPPPTAPVRDGLRIHVARAEPVTVVLPDGAQRLRVVAASVGQVLSVAEVEPVPGMRVTPPRTAPVTPGMRIHVEIPVAVRVTADGTDHLVRVIPGRVADALARAGVVVSPGDLVMPPPAAPLADGLHVVVRRIGSDQVVEEVALPFQEVVRENPDRWEGERDVVQDGVEGLRRDTYRVRLVDGQPVGRDLVAQEVVREPVDRVVEVGTRKRPVAPAVPTDSIWDALADCESHGNWQMDGTYDGGLQFHPDTWRRWKPAGYPEYAYQATREQQILVATRLQAARGWAPWRTCASRLGLL